MTAPKIQHQHPAEVNQPDHPQLSSAKVYTITLPANGSFLLPSPNTNFFITGATGLVAVQGDTFGQIDGLGAGQGLNGVPFNRLTLIDQSGAANTVKILVAPGEFTNQILAGIVNLAAGSTVGLSAGATVGLSAGATVSITASQVLQMIRPEGHTNYFVDGSAMAANTPTQLVAPATNVNGVLILSAALSDFQASSVANVVTLLSNTATPTSPTNGAIYLSTAENQFVSASGIWYSGQLNFEQFVPAGQGLYICSAVATAVNAAVIRHCRYKVL